MFTNADNSEKDIPRRQIVFVHVTQKATGQPVPFILYDTGRGGNGRDLDTLMLELVVPFSAEEHKARIADPIKALHVSVEQLFGKSNGFTLEQTLESMDFHESKPGDYVVRLDYFSPGGKIVSNPLDFTIRDKGNLYEIFVRGLMRSK